MTMMLLVGLRNNHSLFIESIDNLGQITEIGAEWKLVFRSSEHTILTILICEEQQITLCVLEICINHTWTVIYERLRQILQSVNISLKCKPNILSFVSLTL